MVKISKELIYIMKLTDMLIWVFEQALEELLRSFCCTTDTYKKKNDFHISLSEMSRGLICKIPKYEPDY